MKMSKELQAKITDAITTKVFNHPDFETYKSNYEKGKFPRADNVNDLNKRFRWDIFWLVNNATPFGDELDREGLSQAHIDTFLKSVIPAIERKY